MPAIAAATNSAGPAAATYLLPACSSCPAGTAAAAMNPAIAAAMNPAGAAAWLLQLFYCLTELLAYCRQQVWWWRRW